MLLACRQVLSGPRYMLCSRQTRQLRPLVTAVPDVLQPLLGAMCRIAHTALLSPETSQCKLLYTGEERIVCIPPLNHPPFSRECDEEDKFFPYGALLEGEHGCEKKPLLLSILPNTYAHGGHTSKGEKRPDWNEGRAMYHYVKSAILLSVAAIVCESVD